MDLLIPNPIHTIILIISLIGVIISIIQMVRYPHRLGYMIAPFTYLLNTLFYNIALHLSLYANINLLSSSGLETWSSVVRLHSLFLFIAYIIIQPIKKAGE